MVCFQSFEKKRKKNILLVDRKCSKKRQTRIRDFVWGRGQRPKPPVSMHLANKDNAQFNTCLRFFCLLLFQNKDNMQKIIVGWKEYGLLFLKVSYFERVEVGNDHLLETKWPLNYSEKCSSSNLFPCRIYRTTGCIKNSKIDHFEHRRT